MTQNDVVKWLTEKTMVTLGPSLDMGEIEKAIDRASLEIRRSALEHIVCQRTSKAPFECSVCHTKLNVVAYRRKRTVASTFGAIAFQRSYGYCTKCKKHLYPADIALGLQERAHSSPRIQEICALTTLRAPAGQAEEDVYRLTGVTLDASTIHRESRRQGERALKLRENDENLTQNLKGVAELAARAPKLPKHSTMVIEIDAWNIRERDNWGKTKAFRKVGKDPERWHWVYTATIFRLDQRTSTETGRSVITERGYVATRRGIESFQKQLYAEALQRGLLDAETVLVIADGAIWIWNIVQDRFKQAKQRVDIHHVQEHLWRLAKELHGQDSPEAQKWVEPYLRWLEKRNNGALDVINSLEQLSKNIHEYSRKQRAAITAELHYFNVHKNRMDYKEGKSAGQPIGSGAIESTCSQYQRRFKLTGQFWSLQGDEALLALATLHRNGSWSRLFPHDDT